MPARLRATCSLLPRCSAAQPPPLPVPSPDALRPCPPAGRCSPLFVWRACARACVHVCVCALRVGEGGAWSPAPAQESHAGFPLPGRKESVIRANNDPGKLPEPGAPAVGGGSGGGRLAGPAATGWNLLVTARLWWILTGECHRLAAVLDWREGRGRLPGTDLSRAPSSWRAAGGACPITRGLWDPGWATRCYP